MNNEIKPRKVQNSSQSGALGARHTGDVQVGDDVLYYKSADSLGERCRVQAITVANGLPSVYEMTSLSTGESRQATRRNIENSQQVMTRALEARRAAKRAVDQPGALLYARLGAIEIARCKRVYADWMKVQKVLEQRRADGVPLGDFDLSTKHIYTNEELEFLSLTHRGRPMTEPDVIAIFGPEEGQRRLKEHRDRLLTSSCKVTDAHVTMKDGSKHPLDAIDDLIGSIAFNRIEPTSSDPRRFMYGAADIDLSGSVGKDPQVGSRQRAVRESDWQVGDGVCAKRTTMLVYPWGQSRTKRGPGKGRLRANFLRG